MAVDASGNLYIADTLNNMVEKVTPGGTLSVIAGNGSVGSPTPGPATASALNGPADVAVDSAGNVYIADFSNSMVEKVDPAGNLSIVAGTTGGFGAPIPGPATNSPLGEPNGLAIDRNNNLYIVDYGDNYVYKVDAAGILSIVAGTGTAGSPTPGPATNSDLQAPWAIAVDSNGNLYIGDYGNQVVEKVAPDGNLSIYAGNGTQGPPTYGSPADSSALNDPEGVAVDSTGALYIADKNNETVDRVAGLPPAPPGQPTLTPGDGSAQMSFTPPVDAGTSAVTSYQISLDGGATWITITTSPGPNGTLTATLTGLTDGTTYNVIVRAVNNSGPGAASPSGSVTPQASAPQNTRPPAITGTAGVDQSLTCLPGTWTGAGRYTYVWLLDGVPIPGATGPTYTPTSADQGHTLTCTVTAYSSSGATSQATSPGVLIPIVNVSLCPAPSGKLSGTHLGPLWVGLSRTRARRMLPRFNVYSPHTDNFCLAGGAGIRVGYETRHLQRKLPGHPHAKGIVLALTANPYYSLDGIRPDSSLRAAAARLNLGKPIHWGPNRWYVIPGPEASWVLKAQQGTIREIGIASNRLTGTHVDATWLLASF